MELCAMMLIVDEEYHHLDPEQIATDFSILGVTRVEAGR